MIKLTYGYAVYVRHIVEDHIKDERKKKAEGNRRFKGNRHLEVCEKILADIAYQMRNDEGVD